MAGEAQDERSRRPRRVRVLRHNVPPCPRDKEVLLFSREGTQRKNLASGSSQIHVHNGEHGNGRLPIGVERWVIFVTFARERTRRNVLPRRLNEP